MTDKTYAFTRAQLITQLEPVGGVDGALTSLDTLLAMAGAFVPALGDTSELAGVLRGFITSFLTASERVSLTYESPTTRITLVIE